MSIDASSCLDIYRSFDINAYSILVEGWLKMKRVSEMTDVCVYAWHEKWV